MTRKCREITDAKGVNSKQNAQVTHTSKSSFWHQATGKTRSKHQGDVWQQVRCALAAVNGTKTSTDTAWPKKANECSKGGDYYKTHINMNYPLVI